MAINNIFRPLSPTVTLAVTSTSDRVAKTVPPQNGGASHEVRIANTGTAVAFIAFGNSAVAATVAAGIPILPNTVESFEIAASATHVAAITSSGTATIHVTSGFGL
jgi:hypothetical protein